MDWNPELYLAFEGGRKQPSVDLVARVDVTDPARVLDVGCGPGNSTAVLAGRWPDAEIIGLDSSTTMLDKARTTYPVGTWVQADATAGLGHLGTFDVVFSNAVIQWIPDQETLLRDLFALLRPGGVLAVQVPNTACMPVRTVLEELASQPRWRTRFDDVAHTYPHAPSYYYDVLSQLTSALELWVTDYLHIMPSHDALVQWYSGTALRPYLDHLTDDTEQAAFLAEYHDLLVPAYPPQPDGNILFAFHRIFFTARAA